MPFATAVLLTVSSWWPNRSSPLTSNSEAPATDTSRNTVGWPSGIRFTSRSSCHLSGYSC